MRIEDEKTMHKVEDENLNALLKTQFYTIGIYTIDVQKRLLILNGVTIRLTTKEFDLLSLFAANPNETLERKYMLKTVWEDDNYSCARSMDVYICKLRKLLKEDSNVYIINIHGRGYKMITPPPAL